MMYAIIRKIHLYSCLIIGVFLLMYFVTGYPLIHHGLLPEGETRTVTHVYALPQAGQMDAADYSEFLRQTYHLSGQRQKPRRLEDGSWRFRYSRPGMNYEALVSAEGDSVKITESSGSLSLTLGGFHRLHGYGGGWLYDLWSLFYDLASLSLIIFAVTGVYMWYKLMPKKRLGWLLLGGSFVYTLATFLYLIYVP